MVLQVAGYKLQVNLWLRGSDQAAGEPVTCIHQA